MSEESYIASIEKIRFERDQRVKTNPLSWLSLVGLFPLNEGDNPFSGEDKDGLFLLGLEAGQGGIFHLADGNVTIVAPAGSGITINGNSPVSRPLQTDTDRVPDLIEAGSLAIRIIHRGSLTYLRVWDKESPAWKDFEGYRYYPVKPEYCVTAEFVRYDAPRMMKIQNVLGDISDTAFPGEAHFKINEKKCVLIAEDAEDELLFSFTDKTREDTTYPGGRFITVPKSENDRLTLDFNLAVNWPCAYTSYATCPLPPFENRLQVRIEAGELRYH